MHTHSLSANIICNSLKSRNILNVKQRHEKSYQQFNVTLKRIIKNMGKGSQQIVNIESKIQNNIANIFLFLFKYNKYNK